MILLVDEDHFGLVGVGFRVIHKAVTDEDNEVAGVNEVGGGTVDGDNAGAALPRNAVGGEAVAVIDINNVYFFAFQQVGGFHEGNVNGAGAYIVEVCLCDGGSMDFGFQHGAKHGVTSLVVPGLEHQSHIVNKSSSANTRRQEQAGRQ